MDIHEYQAKELLAGFGVPVPRGSVAYNADQAVYAATELGGWHWAVKAQIEREDWPVDYALVLAHLDKAIAADPKNATAFLWRGVAWMHLILALGAVISMTAVLLVFQLGQTRIFFSMSRDGGPVLPAQ